MEHSLPSNSTMIDWLNSVNKPFVAVAETALCETWENNPDKKWFVLDGKEMPDWTTAFRLLREIFQLPTHFGNNLNALRECLCDMDVLKGSAFVVQIQNASSALNRANPDALQGLIDAFVDVAEELAIPINFNQSWDRSAIPFHVLLCNTCADLRFEGFPAAPGVKFGNQ